MKKLSVLVSALIFCTTVPVDARKTVSISDFAPANCTDYTPVVLEILRENPQGGITIKFDNSVYDFKKTYAKGEYHPVTNHDNCYRYFAFPLKGMKDVTIDGNGASFIFHDVMTPFLVDESENIELKNFTIDWNEMFYIQGTVMKSDPSDKSMTLKFTDFSQIEYENGRLNLTNNDNMMYFLGECMVFDPETKAVAWNASRNLLGGPRTRQITCRPAGEDTYEISAPFFKNPAEEGLVYIFKGPNSENRMSPAIRVVDTKNFKAENIDIHHAGGMGIIAEKSWNLHLDDVNVVLPENTDRMVTTTADATHFCNCRGALVIENCIFENMLDDATNVHGTYMKVEKVLDNTSVLAKLNHPQQFDYDFAAEGDQIQIVAESSILPKADLIVNSFEKINEVYAIVSFKSEIDGKVAPGDGLENMTWYPELIFRNNIVRNNRARSILISTPRKVLIENNSFSSMMANILFEGDLEHWHESGAVTDITIRKNKFLDSCYGGNKASAIYINPHVFSMPENEYYERNIVIEDNEFTSFHRSVVNAKSVDGLVIRNNRIRPSSNYKEIFPDLPEINLIHCNGFILEANEFEKAGKSAEVVMDEYSKSRVASIKKNENFNIR